jgi:molybdate-binding protein
MKHIKLFEDYSDEELKDLQDDLQGIGHKSRFVQGEDFGFGRDLKQENTGTYFLYITEEVFNLLVQRGDLERPKINDFEWKFKDPKKWELEKNSPYFSGRLGLYALIMPPQESFKSDYDKVAKKLGEIRI